MKPYGSAETAVVAIAEQLVMCNHHINNEARF